MSKINETRIYTLTKISVIAAIYVVATLLITPLSYGIIQLRLSEALMLLCCYNKNYCVALSIGCMISNMFSPSAAFDVPIGTLATVISAFLMFKCKKLVPSAIICSMTNGIIVGLELTFVFNEPFWLASTSVFAGQLICTLAIGVPIFYSIENKSAFKRFIGRRN